MNAPESGIPAARATLQTPLNANAPAAGFVTLSEAKLTNAYRQWDRLSVQAS